MQTPSPASSTASQNELIPASAQLPIWPQDLRAIPNAFARSALFNVSNSRKGSRQIFKRHRIAALKGISIDYTGEELRQDDEDVFMQIVHLARMENLGNPVRFTAHALIRQVDWSVKSASYSRLIDTLDRLKASSISVTVETKSHRENFTGSLIRYFKWREQEMSGSSEFSNVALREWEVALEPEIISLFSPVSYSRIDWGMRLKLSPLEKWLHSFYHSHQTPYPISISLLHDLTGSEIPKKDLRKFRYKIKLALEELVRLGFFKQASIDPSTDCIVVERNRIHQSIACR